MTVPNGADGIDTANGLLLVSAYGGGDLSPADLVGNDQDTVMALYKGRYLDNGNSVWTDPSGPLGLVFSTLGAIPGIGFAEAILFQLVGAIVALIGPIPIIGPIVQSLANFLGLTHTTANTATDNANNAQNSADNANTGVAQLNAQLAVIVAPPGGVVLTDNFDRTGDSLGTNYFQKYFGPGAGTLETDGNNALWDITGSGSAICRAHHITPLTTNNQMCSIVQTAPKNASNTDPNLQLILRANASMTECVTALVWFDAVEIGYVIADSYQRLGVVEALDSANGDRWEFRAGTEANNRQFLLYRNDGLVCDRTDVANLSIMGSFNLFAGFGMQAGQTFVPFLGFIQSSPPEIQGWAAADRAAAPAPGS